MSKKNIVVGCLLAVAIAGTCGNAVGAVVLAHKMQTVEKTVSDLNASNETRENDVVIDNDYTIRSTEQISDAYKSGDTSSLSAEDQETLQMAEDVLNEIITDGMSDYDKEKAFYDWMCANLETDSGSMAVVPTTGNDVDNPHGVLENHKAVCVGYATTFRMFMQMMDINCMVCHNVEEYHSWDLVQLDGNWYHTDIYSDVGVGSYAHFNMDDDMLSAEQDWDTDFFPAATSLEYNLLNKEAEDCDDIYEIPSIVKDAIEDGKNSVSIRVSEDLYTNSYMQLDTMFTEISTAASANCDMENGYVYYSSYAMEGSYVYVVSIETYEEYDDVDDDTITDEETQKIQDAVTDAFGEYESIDDMGYYEEYSCDDAEAMEAMG